MNPAIDVIAVCLVSLLVMPAEAQEGNAPIAFFSGAERVWQFFEDKRR
jgi:hypothetical protein